MPGRLFEKNMRITSVFSLLNLKKMVRHIRRNAKVADIYNISGERKRSGHD